MLREHFGPIHSYMAILVSPEVFYREGMKNKPKK